MLSIPILSCCLPGVCPWGRALELWAVPAPCIAPGLAQPCRFSFVLYNEINFYTPSVHSPRPVTVLSLAWGGGPEGRGCQPIWGRLWGFGVQTEAWLLDEALALLSSSVPPPSLLPFPSGSSSLSYFCLCRLHHRRWAPGTRSQCRKGIFPAPLQGLTAAPGTAKPHRASLPWDVVLGSPHSGWMGPM